MARIRTIKPEFWGDEKLAPLSPLDRLVFLGLISMADDAGRIIDNVKSIDGFLFPHTEDSSRDSLDTLATSGRIARYSAASGQRIIQVSHWQRHQKVDKPSKHVLPEPSRDSRETVAESSRSDLGPRTTDLVSRTVEVDRRADARGDGELNTNAVDLYEQALADLRDRLTPFPGASAELDVFLAGLPNAAKRLVWARSLLTSLEPIAGGRRVPPGALAAALADFNLADRARYAYTGACFRAFVDRAEAEMNRPSNTPIAGVSHIGDVLDQWARDAEARDKVKNHA